MDERNKRISDGLEYAKKMEAELNEIDAKRSKLISEANSQADEIVSSAKNFATEEAEKQQEKSKKATENMLAKARVDIANERNAIFIGLKSELKNLVVEVTKGVLQRDLSDAEKLQYGQHAVEILTKTA
jgi:F-type H+-transporting ATPase subunit b